MNNGEFYQEEVLPAIFRSLDSVFPEFGWKKTRDGWLATNQSFTKNALGTGADRIVCNQGPGGRPPAGYMAHGENVPKLWTAYLNGGVKPDGERFCEIVEELAKRVNLDYDKYVNNDAASEAYRTARSQRRDRLSGARARLGEPIGKDIRSYLASRGLSYSDAAEQSELGCTEDGLGCVIPMRDERGSLQGFAIRFIDGRKPKYKYTTGFNWGLIGASNLYNCKRSANLVIVEGIIEPELMRHAGIHLASIGGAGDKLTEDLWKRLIGLGFEKVVLALDSDEAGRKGSDKALGCLRRIAPESSCFIVTSEAMRGCKDLGELFQRDGAAAVTDAITAAVPHLTFEARNLVDRARSQQFSAASIRHACAAGTAFLAKHNFPAHLVRLDFWSVFREEVPGFDDEMLREVTDYVEKKAAAQALQEKTKQVQVDLDTVLRTSGPEAYVKGLTQAAASLEEVLSKASGDAKHQTLKEAFLQRKEELKGFRGRQETLIGIPQRTIKPLDDATCGLRGLILVPAPPNLGKTAFCLQLGLDSVRQNIDTCFAFASLEMSRKQMIDRMMCNLAEMDWRRYVFGSKRGNVLAPFWPQELEKLAAAEEHLMRLLPRIEIFDKEMLKGVDAKGLKKRVEAFKNQVGCERSFVLVDYLQKWPIPDEVRRSRAPGDVDAYVMSEMQALSTSDADPVMVISATRKGSSEGGTWQNGLDQALGSGINTYAPDMVLSMQWGSDEAVADLWNAHVLGDDKIKAGKSEKEFRKKVKPVRDKAMKNAGLSYVTLHIAKGRDGVEREEIPLTYRFRSSSFVPGWIWSDEITRQEKKKTDGEQQLQIVVPPVSGDAGEVRAG